MSRRDSSTTQTRPDLLESRSRSSVYRLRCRRDNEFVLIVAAVDAADVVVLVLVTGGSAEILMNLEFNRGDLLMLVACVCYAAYTVGLSRRIDMPPALMLAFFSVPASIVFALCMGVEFWRGTAIMPGPKGLVIVAYCAIFPSMLAQIFFMRGVELAGANRAGFYLNLIPVFAALMAVFILSESLYSYHAISLVMVLGGIYLAEKHKPAPQQDAG